MREDAPLRLPQPAADVYFPAAEQTLYAADFGGEGPPLVMHHGGLADHRAALLRTAPLIGALRLLTPDLRGCGRSPARAPLTWDRLADDTAALLDHLRIERAVIGGVSAGCAVSTAFALRHPERCAGLVLITPAHGGAALGLLPEQRGALTLMHARAQQALTDGLGPLLALYDPLPAPIRAVAREMARGFDPASVVHHTALLASGAQPFADGADLARFAGPALLVPGGDAHHPAAVSAVFAAHLRHCVTHPSETEGFADAVRALVARADLGDPIGALR